MLTLNFDESLERTHAAANISYGSVSSANEPDIVNFIRKVDEPNLSRQVVHLHGKISDTQGSLTLTEDEYRQLYRNNPLYSHLLWLIAASRTLVFVGFGFNDSDFLSSLRSTARDIRAYGTCHFAIVGLEHAVDDRARRTDFNETYLVDPVFYEVGPNSRTEGSITGSVR